MQLYPTSAQVHEMLQCTKKYANRTSTDYLTFTEFCLFATELKRSSHTRSYRPGHFLKLFEKDGQFEKRKKARKISDDNRSLCTKYEVFLGGSCNPTTWRQDEAIPLLDRYGISYYNPQVPEWSPELIELEFRMKEEVLILFYVIDKKTRNIVSLIEVANFIAANRILVLAILPYEGGTEPKICSETISKREIDELKNAVSLIQFLSTKACSPIFENIPSAVNYTASILKQDRPPLQTMVDDNSRFLLKVREVFHKMDKEKKGRISYDDARKAIKMINQNIKSSEVISSKLKEQMKDSKNIKIDFDQFWKIASSMRLSFDKSPSVVRSNGFKNGSRLLRSISSPQGNQHKRPVQTSLSVDVCFVGEKENDWKNEFAIPLIKKTGLTYDFEEMDTIMTEEKFSKICNSNVILLVIPNNKRSFSTMILASYFIAAGANVVLCLQPMSEKCLIKSEMQIFEQVSQKAACDYNRGRAYLSDFAKRNNVPMFKCIEESIEMAISKSVD